MIKKIESEDKACEREREREREEDHQTRHTKQGFRVFHSCCRVHEHKTLVVERIVLAQPAQFHLKFHAGLFCLFLTLLKNIHKRPPRGTDRTGCMLQCYDRGRYGK